MRFESTLEIALPAAQKKKTMYTHDITTVHHEVKRRNFVRSRKEWSGHLFELV